MRVLPGFTGRDESAALVVRTDYGDEAAWQAVVEKLPGPWGDEARFHLVDEPLWSGASPDAVMAAAAEDENLSVVFVADAVTMRSPLHAVLALTTEEEDWDPEPVLDEGRMVAPAPRRFRTVPAAVHAVNAHPALADMEFGDYVEAASREPDHIHRSF
ncbi:hypothetical protein [Streptomyces sp. NPDC047108]|uniref:DUF6924 domain-containing protein n=1 Tax=Streptomyces sp. NPDC047108 TaxID=3155025 RepID=UPI0033E34D42